jgi:hypothetical protein
MIIHSKLVYQWCDSIEKYVLIKDISYPFNGRVALCKGAGAQLTSIGKSQQNFMNTLQQDYGTAFSGQQNILNNLTKSLTSTLQQGPGQYGFSQPETSALNTLATSGNAAQYQAAKQAAGAAAASAGGGNTVLPSSAANQTQAQIASQAAQNQSNQLLGIKEAGYQQGNQNYNTALSGLNNTASLENPNGVASTANTAGSGAAGTATTAQNLNNAASPWAIAGGVLGGLADAAVGGLTGGLTGGIGSAPGGISSLATGGGAPLTGGIDYGPPDTSGVAGGLANIAGMSGMPSF